MNSYNYDVEEMVNSFSLEDFLIPQKNSVQKDAFLLVTDNQYVLGYSKCNGVGDFKEAVSNSVREIYGLRDFTYRREIDRVSEFVLSNFITASIVNSQKAGVYLAFNIKQCGKISEKQLEMFKQFYDKYNEKIKLFSEKLGYPIVKYSLPSKSPRIDDYGNVIEDIYYDSTSLDELLSLFQSRTKVDKVCPTDGKIIGETIVEKNKMLTR